jgi:hypothetical protein
MGTWLALTAGANGGSQRWELEEGDEENLAAAFRLLAPYVIEPESATLVHGRDGETIASWDSAGARRFAEAVPPAYSELAQAILGRLHE